ncbi:hypothetical protein [Natronococcus roseus]|uniref:hypothetical protein n=1 Tax=Natronococcus roseus TaxID=1052014 RepID=UPI00374CE50F
MTDRVTPSVVYAVGVMVGTSLSPQSTAEIAAIGLVSFVGYMAVLLALETLDRR